jgi:hypothetical protein
MFKKILLSSVLLTGALGISTTPVNATINDTNQSPKTFNLSKIHSPIDSKSAANNKGSWNNGQWDALYPYEFSGSFQLPQIIKVKEGLSSLEFVVANDKPLQFRFELTSLATGEVKTSWNLPFIPNDEFYAFFNFNDLAPGDYTITVIALEDEHRNKVDHKGIIGYINWEWSTE